MESTSSPPWQNDDVWELRRDDDGFVYKRKKRHRPDDDPASPSSSSSAADLTDAAAEARRREWRKNALLKVKTTYQAELESWELVSNRLKEMGAKTSQIQRWRLEPETVSFGGSEKQCSEAVLDEILLQVEAQESIIAEVSDLCDMVEAVCRTQEEDVAQSLIGLPIWGSPHELMKLGDE